MLKKALLLGTALAMFTACNSGDSSKEGTNITVQAPEGEELILSELNPSGTKALDTLISSNGEVSFSLETDSANFYMVSLPSVQSNIPIFVQPDEDVKLNITVDTLTGGTQYTVTGSEESQRIKEINEVVEQSKSRLDSLAELMRTENGQLDRASFQAIYMDELEKSRKQLIEYIEAQPGSIANLFVWPQTLGNQQLVPAQDYMKYYDTVAVALVKAYPNVEHATFFADQLVKIKENVERGKRLEEAKKNIALGKTVPNINLPDTTGQNRSLEDLRGKVVLVDFWAAWCRPCRAENPNLVRTYKEFKDRGFTVYSVSLDGLPNQPNPKMAWTQAIQQDGLVWENHVSDLQGWNSSVVDQFGFQGIPFTVLIDEDGKILGTNLRGPALKEKLSKVFADK
mgnify:CR=1 FL=1